MHHNYADLRKLLLPVPYFDIASERRRIVFLREITINGKELDDILVQYPAVIDQSLDSHYLCLQSLRVLSYDLMEDLLSSMGTVGVAWGLFLACLWPNKLYRQLLVQSTVQESYHKKLAELAIAQLDITDTSLKTEEALLFDALGQQLKTCNIAPVQLKKSLPETILLERQALVRKVYREQGADAALVLIKQFQAQ